MRTAPRFIAARVVCRPAGCTLPSAHGRTLLPHDCTRSAGSHCIVVACSWGVMSTCSWPHTASTRDYKRGNVYSTMCGSLFNGPRPCGVCLEFEWKA
jgi:hypothetical protein